MTHCPCCSNQMLRHIRLHETYWFCRHCWQEMPNFSLTTSKSVLSMGVRTTSSVREQIYANSSKSVNTLEHQVYAAQRSR